MPKKDLDTDDFVISETGNWNVADQYSKLKIMKPLYLSDEYSDIAVFGTSSLLEDLNLPEGINIDHLKILGFRRLIRTLITLIDNTSFAIKGEKDKEEMGKYREELLKIENIVSQLYNIKSDMILKKREIVINNNYQKILKRVLVIKAKINIPLNHNHLIFTDKEEFDPKAFKNALKDRMINKG